MVVMHSAARQLVLAAPLAALIASSAEAGPAFDAPCRYFPTAGVSIYVAAGLLGLGGSGGGSPPRRDATVLVVVSHPDRTLELLVANSNGDLDPLAIIPIGNQPHGVAIADFDRDGCGDVVSGGFDPPGITLLRGRCGGTFDAPILIPTPTSVDAIAVADLDADGFPDLVGWSAEGGVVLLNDGSGGFRAPITFRGSYSGTIAVGRIDPDPYPDLVVGPAGSFTVRFGRGDGTFGVGDSSAAGDPSLVDLDRDGDLDVVAGSNQSPSDGGMRVSFNDGSGHFPTSWYLYVGSRPVVPTLAYSHVVRTAIGDVQFDQVGHRSVLRRSVAGVYVPAPR